MSTRGCDSNRSNTCPVKRPHSKFQPATRGIAVTTTPDDIVGHLLDRLLDNASSPGMNDVQYLALVPNKPASLRTGA